MTFLYKQTLLSYCNSHKFFKVTFFLLKLYLLIYFLFTNTYSAYDTCSFKFCYTKYLMHVACYVPLNHILERYYTTKKGKTNNCKVGTIVRNTEHEQLFQFSKYI